MEVGDKVGDEQWLQLLFIGILFTTWNEATNFDVILVTTEVERNFCFEKRERRREK